MPQGCGKGSPKRVYSAESTSSSLRNRPDPPHIAVAEWNGGDTTAGAGERPARWDGPRLSSIRLAMAAQWATAGLRPHACAPSRRSLRPQRKARTQPAPASTSARPAPSALPCTARSDKSVQLPCVACPFRRIKADCVSQFAKNGQYSFGVAVHFWVTRHHMRDLRPCISQKTGLTYEYRNGRRRRRIPTRRRRPFCREASVA